MSEDRDTFENEDVEAHVKHGRPASSEPGQDDSDVEAHVKHGRPATTDPDQGDDDVEAHVRMK
jgi:hypothetical protein